MTYRILITGGRLHGQHVAVGAADEWSAIAQMRPLLDVLNEPHTTWTWPVLHVPGAPMLFGVEPDVETIREPNMQEREDIAWEALESMIASAFEALPPRRRRAMMKRLGPAVAEDWAIRSGALKPLPPTGNAS